MSELLTMLTAQECGFNALSWVTDAGVQARQFLDGTDDYSFVDEIAPQTLLKNTAEQCGVTLSGEDLPRVWRAISWELHMTAGGGYADYHPDYPLISADELAGFAKTYRSHGNTTQQGEIA